MRPHSQMFVMAAIVILVLMFLALLCLGGEFPDPQTQPFEWVKSMHGQEGVQLALNMVADKQVKGDTCVLDEVGAAFEGVDAYGRRAWVFMVRFHRRDCLAEVAMITLIPNPKPIIQVVTLTQPNL
jgi:hypothetical protein